MEKSWRKIVNLFQGSNTSQEIKQFQSLVSSCKNDDDIINCFDFFVTHFKEIDADTDIKSTNLINGICNFAKIFTPYFSKKIDTFENKIGGFNFLSIYVAINNIDKETLREISDFLLFLIKKDPEIIEAKQFIDRSLQTKSILQIVLSTKNINDVFLTIFTKSPKSFTKAIINSLPNANYNSKDDFSTLIESIFSTIKSNSINEYYDAFNFIGILFKKIYNRDLVSRFFAVSKQHFVKLQSFDFYLNFLQMPDDIEYKFLNEILHDPDLNLSLLNSMISILYISDNIDKLYFIDFNFFLKNIKLINEERQDDLFKMILQSCQSKQFEAFKTIFPPWKNNIDSKFFLDLTKSVSNRQAVEVVDIFLLQDENLTLNDLYIQIEKDPNIAEATEYVVSNISNKKITQITPLLLILSSKNCQTAINALKNLLPRSKPEWITTPIIDFLKVNKLPDDLFNTLSEIAIRKSDFVSLFLQNGIEPLFNSLEGFASIDFLAALACNGPHSQIEDYINNNFDKTVLKNLPESNLKNLALGLPHDSDSFGLLRIPSLIQYTSGITLRTPFDRYIYGKMCTKTIPLPNKDSNSSEKPYFDKKTMSFLRQYIGKNRGIDKKLIFSDPMCVYHMVKGKMPFCNLYQLHFEMPHAVAEVHLKSTFGFWFFIKHIIGQTILFSTKTGAVSYDCDGIHAFNKPPIECTLKRWHFLVLVTQSKNFQLTNYASVYLDGKKIFDNFVQLSDKLIIGSEDKNKAIWYIKDDFLIAEEAYSQSEIQNAFSKGVYQRTAQNYLKPEINCQPGFQFVKYKSIGVYLNQIGSPEYIFLQMLKDSNDSKSFLTWMKCAFILLRKDEIELNFFNQAMKYAILKKGEFFNSECQEFALSSFHTRSYSVIFGDLQIISSPSICFDFLPKIFSFNYDFDDLFDQILDAYCILELSDETKSYIEGGIISYMKRMPNAIERIILTAVALHKISDDKKYEIDKPPENPVIMKKLIEIATQDQEIYIKSIDFSTSLYFVALLPDDFAFEFLKYLSQICIKFPKYWDVNSLKQSTPFLISLYKKEATWCFLLTLLTNKYFDSIDEYTKTTPSNIEVLKILLDIIASIIRIEIQSTDSNLNPKQIELLNFQLNQTDILFSGSDAQASSNEEEEDEGDDNEKSTKSVVESFNFDQEFVSFRTLLLLREICSDKQFLLCPQQIERLCSLGFDKLSFQSYPFSKSSKKAKNAEQPSIPIFIDIDRTSVLSANIHTITMKYLRRYTHYDKLQKKEKSKKLDFSNIMNTNTNNTINRSNFKNIKVPEEIPKNIKLSDLFNTKTVNTIVDLASKLLINQSRNVFSNLRKLFARYTIFGSDVHSGIANMMHNSISLYIMKKAAEMKGIDSISSECANQFFGFLTNRILEGLWTLNKMITLFNFSLVIIKSNTTNFKLLALVTLSKIKSIETRIDILCDLLSNDVFCGYLKNDSKYFTAILHFICTNEVSKSPKFDKLYETMTQKSKFIPKTEFCKALLDKSQLIWFSYQDDQYDDIYNDIKRYAEQSTDSLRQFRASFATLPIHPNYLETIKIRNIKNLILRRSFRFEIFYHLNEMNFFSEDVLIKLFRKDREIDFFLNPPDKFMSVRGPQPFTVPQKMDPLVYSFSVPFKKTHRQIPLLRSKHIPHFKSILPEICQEKSAAVCLSNWTLPPYCSSCAVLETLETIWNTDSIIKCDMLSTPEVMPCVCSIGNESLEMLFNSTIDDSTGRIVLPESSDMLCHFEAFEVSAYGFYGNTQQGSSSFFCNRSLISIKYSDITLVVERRYAYQPRMVDIFTTGGNQYTIIFDSEKNKKLFMKKSKSKIKQMSDSNVGIGFSQRLLMNTSLDQVTKFWTSGNLSTLDYLLYVNISAGRSFNDTSQYPVFPWILGYFENDEPSVARDLTKTMGAQNDTRRDRFILTYQETNYHYGTHYSHSAAILHYMLRIEPFTFFSIHLHNGWDHKDRLFCNLAEAWHSASDTNQADVKELIPEFYSVPQIFENPNKLELGERTDGLSLQTVKMPEWGKDTLKFIWQMRIALENADKINDWIDLIFGYKQRGEEAIKNVNCFQPLSYDDALEKNTFGDVDIHAAVDMINNFGQCPAQIFKEPHPARTNSPYGRKTLATSTDPLFVTKLKNTSKYARNVRVLDKSIYVASDNELFVGIAGTAIKIRDDLHEIVLNPQSLISSSAASAISSSPSSPTSPSSSGSSSPSPLSSFSFNPSTSFAFMMQSKPIKEKLVCYCLSSDASMFAVASKYGLAIVRDSKEKIVSKFLTMCNRPTAVALSSQHFILLVADSKMIHMFDATTGYFIRRTQKGLFENDVISILFDDVANLIIAAEKHKITVLGLDFRIVASQKLSEPITKRRPSNIPKVPTHKNENQNKNENDNHEETKSEEENGENTKDDQKESEVENNANNENENQDNDNDESKNKDDNENQDNNNDESKNKDENENQDNNNVESKNIDDNENKDDDENKNRDDDENKNKTDDDEDEGRNSSSEDDDIQIYNNSHFTLGSNAEITCIAVCDSEIWCEEPFFICGRNDGNCEIWTLDVLSSQLMRTNLIKINEPIISVHIFSDNRAALVFGHSGSVTLVSMYNERNGLIGKTFYDRCAICHSNDTSLLCCSRCGLYICRECRAKRMPVICTRCKAHGIGDDTSDASHRYTQVSENAE